MRSGEEVQVELIFFFFFVTAAARRQKMEQEPPPLPSPSPLEFAAEALEGPHEALLEERGRREEPTGKKEENEKKNGGRQARLLDFDPPLLLHRKEKKKTRSDVRRLPARDFRPSCRCHANNPGERRAPAGTSEADGEGAVSLPSVGRLSIARPRAPSVRRRGPAFLLRRKPRRHSAAAASLPSLLERRPRSPASAGPAEAPV